MKWIIDLKLFNNKVKQGYIVEANPVKERAQLLLESEIDWATQIREIGNLFIRLRTFH